MEYENEVLELILSSTGQTAPYMTAKLRKIGNGKMAEGISNLAKYAAQSGIELGEKIGFNKGAIFGSLGTLMVIVGAKTAFDFYQKKLERVSALLDAEKILQNGNADIEPVLLDNNQPQDEDIVVSNDKKGGEL